MSSQNPFKLLFFVWTACSERLPTLAYLQKRGTTLPNMCSLCLQDGKSINHFIHCLFSREVWEDVMNGFGVAWVFPIYLHELFQCWNIDKTSKKGKIFGAWSTRRFVGLFCWRETNGCLRIMLNYLLTYIRMLKKVIG